jgi:hypothetical protein
MEDETSTTINKGKSCHLLAGKGKRRKGKGINSSPSPFTLLLMPKGNWRIPL